MNTEIKELLTNNHNLILTGAPGTGKTYLAKQIAAKMILGKEYDENDDEEKKKMDEQCGFVQFHPSYDYTDFVEGLRPSGENGNIGFERNDGVFKDFCKRAVSKTEQGNNNIEFAQLYEILLQKIKNEEIDSFTQKKGKPIFIEGIKQDTINLVVETEQETEEKSRTYSILFRTLNKLAKTFTNKSSLDDISNIYEEFHNITACSNVSAYWAVLHKIWEIKEDIEKNNNKDIHYVFIIDEINRGDISKIFGELFFSIDPGYRGTKGKVKTQYQNLIKKGNGDLFEDGFYIPENVYIIGTMNDIDRSVESMDFAMRRRFAFKEILAENTMDMINHCEELSSISEEQKKNIKDRMKNLNNCILSIQGFSTAYQIGAAYFLKLKNYLNENNEVTSESWNSLWENHLKGLLFEYLRGLPNAKEDLKKLENAYNLEKTYNEEGKVIEQSNSEATNE